MPTRGDAQGRTPMDLYGDFVSASAQQHPALARGALDFGFGFTAWRTTRLPNRDQLPSAQAASALFFNNLVRALADPQNEAITSIFLPTEVFQALGVRAVTAEAISGTCAGAHSEEGFMSDAEGRGIPETFCSYHKVLLGAAFTGVLRPPRMLASCSVACDANNLTFKTLSRLWDVPHFYVDVPYEPTPDAAIYVGDQLRQMGRLAQEVYGRRLSEPDLTLRVARSQRTLALLAKSLPLRRGRYLAGDLMLELMEVLDVHLSLGTTEAEDIAQQMVDDLAQAAPYGGLNLVWVHTSPFFSGPLTTHLDRSREAQVVASDMFYDTTLFCDPWFGPSQPFEAMGERLVRNCLNGPAERRAACVRRLADQTHADGVVIFCHWGCKQIAGASQIIRKSLEAAGYPVLVIDGDGAHRSNNMAGQVSTRFEAFLELLRFRREENHVTPNRDR